MRLPDRPDSKSNALHLKRDAIFSLMAADDELFMPEV